MLAVQGVATEAHAETPVTIELLLALDCSASMDRSEFELQVKGLEQAFRDPQVLRAAQDLLPLGAAVGVIQWGGAGEYAEVVPFVHLETAQDYQAFGFRVGLAQRAFTGTNTAISTAISKGVDLLNRNEFDGQRRVIDISGDGVDNGGEDLEFARKLAHQNVVTVNGLAVEADDNGLADYYRTHVKTGSDSFVIRATGFEDFARAIKEKLLKELRPLGS